MLRGKDLKFFNPNFEFSENYVNFKSDWLAQCLRILPRLIKRHKFCYKHRHFSLGRYIIIYDSISNFKINRIEVEQLSKNIIIEKKI